MTIFVDMDEVMADAYNAHIEIYNQEYNAQLTKEDCNGREVWQCVHEAHQQSIKDHTHRVGFFRDLKVIPNSQEVLRELNQKYEVYVASAAMEFPNSLREKSDWLDLYFPFIPWQKRILCGHKYILKGDVLIDDRSRNLHTFEGRSIIFTSPHNVHTTDFERAENWLEIAEKLL